MNITVLVAFPLVSVIVGFALMWFSTKTKMDAFQKLFVGLAIALFSFGFLQVGLIQPANLTETCQTNKTYENISGSYKVNSTSTDCSYEGAFLDSFQDGNIALFTVFSFLLVIIGFWFIFNILGLSVEGMMNAFDKI